MKNVLPMLLNKKQQIPGFQKEYLTLIADIKKVPNPSSLLEKVLISKLINGDSTTFCNIFTAFYRDLVMFALRFTNDLSCAEDIVQETFVSLWEDRERISPDITLKSYLLKIVQNKSIDWCRHQKIKQKHSALVNESPVQYEYDTDTYLLYTELQEQIEKALSCLPANVSEVFRMNRNKGLKYHEIAMILGVSVRTIEVRIGQALHLLRHQLKDYILIFWLISIFYR